MEGIVYGVYDLQLENSQLSWKEHQMLYRDMPADKDNYHPVAFDAKVRFYLGNRKLRFEYVPTYYDFEPEDLSKHYLKINILHLSQKNSQIRFLLFHENESCIILVSSKRDRGSFQFPPQTNYFFKFLFRLKTIEIRSLIQTLSF
jgi:hypothetical protein